MKLPCSPHVSGPLPVEVSGDLGAGVKTGCKPRWRPRTGDPRPGSSLGRCVLEEGGKALRTARWLSEGHPDSSGRACGQERREGLSGQLGRGRPAAAKRGSFGTGYQGAVQRSECGRLAAGRPGQHGHGLPSRPSKTLQSCSQSVPDPNSPSPHSTLKGARSAPSACRSQCGRPECLCSVDSCHLVGFRPLTWP